MIRSLKFKPKHYAYKLDCIGKRSFEFPNCRSLTFLFGPNGCGKSTILKALASGSASLKGGWSHPLTPTEYGIGIDEEKYDVKTALNKGTEVNWDGTPSFYLDASVSDNAGSNIEVNDGIGDAFRSGVERLACRPSSGEWRLNRILGMIEMLNRKQFPNLLIPEFKNGNSTWQKAGIVFSDYIKTLDQTGIPTLLLDEPDRSLSLTNAYELVVGLLPKMARDLQVIVATHSPFCLFVESANVIDLQDGYAAETKSLMRKLAKM